MAGTPSRLDRATLRAIPRSVWALGLVSLCMDLSSEMIHALLPVYLVAVMGASMTTVGLIEGFAEAVVAMTKIVSGTLSDRFGRRKPLTVLGYGLAALTKPIFPLAGSIGWLVAARLLDRVGKGIRGAPRDALVADLSPVHLRGASFGLRQSLDTAGAFLGPLVAILLMALTGGSFTTVFWCAVLPAIAAVVLLVALVHEPDGTRKTAGTPFPLGMAAMTQLGAAYWRVVTIAALFTLARFSEAFLILRAQGAGLPVVLVPGVLIVMNIVYALSAYPAGVLSDGMGRKRLLAAGIGLLIAADLVLAASGTLVGMAVGIVLWGLHLGLTQGLLASLVADTAPAEMRGTAFGMLNLVMGVAVLVASLGAGLFWDSLGAAATFYAGALVAAIALAALFVLGPRISARVP
jgi:MFS family permease